MSTNTKGTLGRRSRVKNPLTKQAGEQQYATLAEKIGVTKSHVCRIMNGNREPSLGVAVKLAKAMQISLDKFVALMQKVASTRPQVVAKKVTVSSRKKSVKQQKPKS